MSKKTNGQHWYQVHKSRAGEESVSSSKEVIESRKKVQELENHASALKATNTDNLGSGLRRLFFGRNQEEELIHQAEEALQKAKSEAFLTEQKVRKNGERAYAANWLSKQSD
jgi:hypothetical protein